MKIKIIKMLGRGDKIIEQFIERRFKWKKKKI